MSIQSPHRALVAGMGALPVPPLVKALCGVGLGVPGNVARSTSPPLPDAHTDVGADCRRVWRDH